MENRLYELCICIRIYTCNQFRFILHRSRRCRIHDVLRDRLRALCPCAAPGGIRYFIPNGAGHDGRTNGRKGTVVRIEVKTVQIERSGSDCGLRHRSNPKAADAHPWRAVINCEDVEKPRIGAFVCKKVKSFPWQIAKDVA